MRLENRLTVAITMNERLSTWATGTIVPTGMHILCIALRDNKPNKSENHKSILFL